MGNPTEPHRVIPVSHTTGIISDAFLFSITIIILRAAVPTECPRSMEEHRRLFWGKFSTFSTHHRQFKTCQENGTLDFLSAQSMGSILAEYSNIVKPKLDSPNPKDDQTIFCQTKYVSSCHRPVIPLLRSRLSSGSPTSTL